jgi:hypothetical protein
LGRACGIATRPLAIFSKNEKRSDVDSIGPSGDDLIVVVSLPKMSGIKREDDRRKVFDGIAARIPMPTPEEQRQLQRENAGQDVLVWGALCGMQEDMVVGHKAMAVAAQRAAAEGEAAASDASRHAERAKERLAKIDRGEDVTDGLGKPVSMEDVLRAAGWTNRDMGKPQRFSVLLDTLEARGIDGDYWQALRKRAEAADRLVGRQAEGDVLRKHGLQWVGRED